MIPFLWLILLTHIRWVNTADLANVSISLVQNIFILAGQSNMSGRGGVTNHGQNGIVNETWDGIIPPECQSNPNILRLSAGFTWVEAQEPLHQDIDLGKVCGVGPGMSFANSVVEKDPSFGVIGLVPCAIGGTNISEWVRGGGLYNQMIRRTEAALQGGGKLQALLWYQGESDTQTLEDAKLYKFRLKRLFKSVRRDLQSPTLPVIQVALASSLGPYKGQVRKAQLGINLPNVRTVDAKGLPVGMDYVHITTLAQVHLGQMLADAFLQTQTTQAVLLPIQTETTQTSNAPKRCSNFVLDVLLGPFR
ncbi:putative carbohydrate esterase At4g34215 [Nicotiana tabacum]|uniref:Carbohydrate esterase At4g34215 n=2 Tax=Nicotiana TaxID=4085 RepID=A0A1S4BLQ1_TOBAC|nr:PREDICTED: probable carbohydrate esterase At4g34215 [Nicotiana sylvestris]XP_016489813.1 PREDICTED: probable carbohydrate esterase At4g34215 [Nicotiana tabacum]